jgi:hypothetical protein
METYKFQLIRADEAQQITHVVSTKFQALTVLSLLREFVDFMAGCGFDRGAVLRCMQDLIDDEEV